MPSCLLPGTARLDHRWLFLAFGFATAGVKTVEYMLVALRDFSGGREAVVVTVFPLARLLPRKLVRAGDKDFRLLVGSFDSDAIKSKGLFVSCPQTSLTD